MEQVVHDPALEICPNFASVPFLVTRNHIIAANPEFTHEQVAQQLVDAWTEDNHARKAVFDQQQHELQVAREEAERIAQEEEDRLREEQQQKDIAEQLELEKKKPKLKPLDKSRQVGDHIAARPSAYALNKLENHEYIELWYFTEEGCQDAADYQHTTTDETFGLSKVDNFLALRAVSAAKASRHAIKDMDLTWRQMTIAKNLLLSYMGRFKWPDEYTQSLAGFFINIELSDRRARPNGERTLIIYQARVRREWHDAIKRNEAFDISVINRELLRTIADEVYETVRAEALKQDSSRSSRSPDRERGRHHRKQSRHFGPSSRPSRHSQSRSPPRASSSKAPPPFPLPKYRLRTSPSSGKMSFHAGASTLGPSACAVCLGRHRHNIAQCNSTTLWDGSDKPRCHRNSEGRLVNPAGQQLCSNWQRPDGCSASGHDSKHECSGCGKSDHGAQLCPRTQKE